MPLTILEAQAAGLPVVATDVGDVADMVGDGVDRTRGGRPREPDALAPALRDLLTDEDRRLAMGRASRERAEAYDQHDMLARLKLIFDDVWGNQMTILCYHAVDPAWQSPLAVTPEAVRDPLPPGWCATAQSCRWRSRCSEDGPRRDDCRAGWWR